MTCQNGDGVSVLDLAEGRETQRWSVPGKPAGVAASTGAVFTVAADSKTLRRHDPGTGDVVKSIQLEGGPMGVAHDPRRGRLFVSDWYNARIWVLGDSDLTHVQDLTVGAAPAGLALSADGRFLASADRDADQVSLFDAATLERLHSISVGSRPFGLRFAPDGRLFVANVGSDDVSVIDTLRGEVVATLPVGARPYGIAFAKGRAFVTNQYEDTVSVIDLETLAPVASLDTGEYPEGIDATADGGRVVIANWFDNTVTLIDAQSLSVLNEIETCDGPRAFGAFLLGDGK